MLAILDLTAPLPDLLASARDIASRVTDEQQLIFLLNKADAVSPEVVEAARSALPERSVFTLSAKKGLGMDALKSALAATWRNLDTAAETTLVTNARHLEALRNAAAALSRVQDGLAAAIPSDLVAQDLRETLYHLGSIVGQVSDNEILGNIFEHFCIGK